jgi:hypothetical protein
MMAGGFFSGGNFEENLTWKKSKNPSKKNQNFFIIPKIKSSLKPFKKGTKIPISKNSLNKTTI